MLSNSLCLQWGKYDPYTDTGNVSFPITFTTIYTIVAFLSKNEGGSISLNRYPYSVSTSGFTRQKITSTGWNAYWIAVGKKD